MGSTCVLPLHVCVGLECGWLGLLLDVFKSKMKRLGGIIFRGLF